MFRELIIPCLSNGISCPAALAQSAPFLGRMSPYRQAVAADTKTLACDCAPSLACQKLKHRCHVLRPHKSVFQMLVIGNWRATFGGSDQFLETGDERNHSCQQRRNASVNCGVVRPVPSAMYAPVLPPDRCCFLPCRGLTIRERATEVRVNGALKIRNRHFPHYRITQYSGVGAKHVHLPRRTIPFTLIVSISKKLVSDFS